MENPDRFIPHTMCDYHIALLVRAFVPMPTTAVFAFAVVIMAAMIVTIVYDSTTITKDFVSPHLIQKASESKQAQSNQRKPSISTSHGYSNPTSSLQTLSSRQMHQRQSRQWPRHTFSPLSLNPTLCLWDSFDFSNTLTSYSPRQICRCQSRQWLRHTFPPISLNPLLRGHLLNPFGACFLTSTFKIFPVPFW
jgi:hypothetical protein